MAQERPSRIEEWWAIARVQAQLLRERFERWKAAVIEEPALIWETPAVRYSAYVIGGLILLWGVSFSVRMITPELPKGARDVATTADFHVVCGDESCAYHFVIRRAMGFSKFPVECSRCNKRTGLRALRCNSSTCGGRWVGPREGDGPPSCPICGSDLD